MNDCRPSRSRGRALFATAHLFLVGFAAVFVTALGFLYPGAYGRVLADAADEFGLPRDLACAVAAVESRMNPRAVSAAGARGLMQLMPDTYRLAVDNVAGITDIDDPVSNARAGCWYLKYLLDKFSVRDALAAYNAGEGKVRDWLAAGLEKYPYPETAAYVHRVERARKVYRYKATWPAAT